MLGLTLLLIGGKVANIKGGKYPRDSPPIKKADDIGGVIALLVIAGTVVFLLIVGI